MGIQDSNIEWIRKRLYWPATQFSGFMPAIRTGSTAVADSTSGALAEDEDGNELSGVRIMDSAIDQTYRAVHLMGVGAGLPLVDEISTFGVTAIKLTAAGDTIAHIVRTPIDLNPEFPIGVRINWASGSSTTADTIDWIALLQFFAEGVAIAAPSSALNTTIAQDNVTGAHHNQWTGRGIKTSGMPTREQVEDGALMSVRIEMNAFAGGLTENKYLLGVEFDYVPHLTRGEGMGRDTERTHTRSIG